MTTRPASRRRMSIDERFELLSPDSMHGRATAAAGRGKPVARQHSECDSACTQRGFTLVELVVVLMVMAVLLAFGATSYAGYSAAQRTSATANRLLADLYMARSAASQRAGEIVLIPSPEQWTQGWRVVAQEDGEEVELAAAETGPVDLRALDRGASAPLDRLVFGRFGELVHPAGGAVFNLCLRGERRAVEVSVSGHAAVRRLPSSEPACD